MARRKKGIDEPDIELRPDGWERFEKAVDVAAKTPAKHRPTKRKTGGAKLPTRRGTRRGSSSA